LTIPLYFIGISALNIIIMVYLECYTSPSGLCCWC